MRRTILLKKTFTCFGLVLISAGNWSCGESSNTALSSSQVEEFEPDGVIGDFKQGQIGDCWFLAGLRAFANDSRGAEKLKSSIQRNEDDDSWYVKPPGLLGGGRKVTRDELNNYKINGQELSRGDADVRLWEIAAHKSNRFLLTSLDRGGWSGRAFKFFTGGPGFFTTGKIKILIRNRLKRRYDRQSDDGAMIALCSGQRNNDLGYPKNHCGTITKMDFESNEFYYVNPWNTGLVLSASIDVLVNDIKNDRIRVRHSSKY